MSTLMNPRPLLDGLELVTAVLDATPYAAYYRYRGLTISVVETPVETDTGTPGVAVRVLESDTDRIFAFRPLVVDSHDVVMIVELARALDYLIDEARASEEGRRR